ncbi:MAG: ABC-F family ATP-binding cassette domain-containing protein [Sandaracinaceae bacterium]|nr:ABC-F family ATP-binding cassette domain-containing protein [Sandaracinaceae bacterium]
MTLLQCDNVTFGYAGDTLFRDLTFRLEAGERLGLVAPNGAGKTTLLRILTGEQTPDSGVVVIPASVSVGYLKQNQHFPDEWTLLDALMSGHGDVVRLREELNEASHAAADGSDDALRRLARVQDRYEMIGGHALEHRVLSAASQVGFGAKDMERKVGSLSGGERGRLSLGVVLAAEPRLLILDEPTNHLDLATTEKLENMLCTFQGAAVIVSHDRAFLDATTNRTGELGSQRFRLYPAPYTEYLVLRQGDLQREEAALTRQRDEIARTEDFIRRNIAGQKTKQAQSRKKQLAKVQRLERSEDVWSEAGRMAFRFVEAPRSGDIVLEASELGATRGTKRLFEHVELLLRRGDRIGIVGPNGAGKTTLLRLLAQKGAPDDEGTIRRGTNLREGYFDQHLESLNPDSTAIEEIQKVRGELVVDAVRTYLARFRITGDDPFRSVASFSGGERTRLALAKLLLIPRNLLFMDEPTNHLDIPATEILEEALAHFVGSVVLVSHDRYFLDRVCTRILHLENGRVRIHAGTYSDWRNAELRSSQAPVVVPTKTQIAGAEIKAKQSYDGQKAAQREVARKQRRAAQLEKDIAQGEAESAQLKAKLLAGDSDWEELARLAQDEQALKTRIDRMMEEWAKLTEEA